MSKYAERLLILREHGDALLERLYHIKEKMGDGTQKPLVFREECTPQVTRVFKVLQKDFPNFPENVEATPGYDFVKTNLNEILKSLTPIYQTFRELNEWGEQAQKTLDEICTTANVEFKADVNILTLTDFMSVMTVYAKNIFLLNRIEERKNLVSFYNLSYTKVNGKSDPTILRVAKLFQDFANPYLRLQEIFFTIQNHVGRILMDLWSIYERGELNYLSNKRPLEMLSEPDKIPLPSVEGHYFDICLHNQITEWIMYGFLCCPEAAGMTHDQQGAPQVKTVANSKSSKEPNQKRGLDLLLKVLGEHYMLPIYGNEVVPVHEPYEELFGRFKSNTLALKKEKKNLAKAEEHAAENAHEIHKQKRIYLRLQLRSLYNMLTDNPGLLGPKFQLILGCLALSKEEMLWYFRHSEVQPKYKLSKFKDVQDTNVGEMIYLIDSVTRVCLKNKDTISSYYKEIIQKLYSKKVREHYNASERKFEGQLVTILDALLADVDNAQNLASFVPFRLNWKRLQAVISGFQHRAYFKDQNIAQFITTMNKVYYYCRHIDDLERELVELASLKELYFYRAEAGKFFRQGLSGKRTQPLYSTAFITILQYYPDNVSKTLNPELRQKIAAESIVYAEKMLSLIAVTIENSLSTLRGPSGYGLLASQIGGAQVVNRLKLRMAKQKEPMKPGEESKWQNRPMIEDMKAVEKQMCQLVFSLGMHDSIQILDTILYPIEFLRERLEAITSAYILKVCTDLSSQPPNNKDGKQAEFLPPSLILNEIKVFIHVLKIVEQCCNNLNVEEMVLACMLENFASLDMIESPYNYQATLETKNSLLARTYARWYTDLVDGTVKYKLLYSPLRRVFVNTKETPFITYRAEDYADIQELTALAELIGPYGLRVFENEILGKAAECVTGIRDSLSQFNSALKEAEQTIYSDSIVELSAKKFKGFESFLTHGIRLGALMVFRDSLHEAQEQTAKENIPAIYNTVTCTTKQYPLNIFKDERFTPVDGLAADLGVVDIQADNAFKKAIAHLTESAAWDVLPMGIAMLLTLPQLNGTPYDVYLEGWSNNLHLALVGFERLMASVCSLKCRDMKSLEREYEKYAEYAAQLLLQMRISAKFNDKNCNTAYVFADKFIKRCKFIKNSTFEDCNPYSLIRAVYIQNYEPTQKQKQQGVEDL